MDLQTGKTAGKIPGTTGVHGITFAPDVNKGFVSDGRTNDVTVFDLKTLEVTGKVATGKHPDAIQYDSVSGRVFTFNGGSNDSTAIDAKTNQVEGTVKLGGRPEFAAPDGKGHIYVNVEDTSEIAELDTRKLVVNKHYSLKPCDSPSGLAMDQKHRILFSVCENKLMAISDPDAGKTISTVPIDGGADGAGFDAGLGLAFSSNGEGTLTVVGQQGGVWKVLESVATEKGARTIAVDGSTHRVYLPTAGLGPLPKASEGTARAYPPIQPDTFRVLVFGKN